MFHKDGLEPIVNELKRLGVTIYSTGGTQSAIEAMGSRVVPVESVTDYPSILGGRVKTLHPKVFGGILNRRTTKATKPKWRSTTSPTSTWSSWICTRSRPVASGASEAGHRRKDRHRRHRPHSRRGQELQRRGHRSVDGRLRHHFGRPEARRSHHPRRTKSPCCERLPRQLSL